MGISSVVIVKKPLGESPVYVIVPSALLYTTVIVSLVHFVPLIFAFVNPASLTAVSTVVPVPSSVLLNVTVTVVAVAEAATSSSA